MFSAHARRLGLMSASAPPSPHHRSAPLSPRAHDVAPLIFPCIQHPDDAIWRDWQIAELQARAGSHGLRFGQILIVVELCHSCAQHRWHMRHADGCYDARFAALESYLQGAFGDMQDSIIIAVPLLTHTGQGGTPTFHGGIWQEGMRLGAFEVLAATLQPSTGDAQPRVSMVELHSKLHTHRWPSAEKMADKIRDSRRVVSVSVGVAAGVAEALGEAPVRRWARDGSVTISLRVGEGSGSQVLACLPTSDGAIHTAEGVRIWQGFLVGQVHFFFDLADPRGLIFPRTELFRAGDRGDAVCHPVITMYPSSRAHLRVVWTPAAKEEEEDVWRVAEALTLTLPRP